VKSYGTGDMPTEGVMNIAIILRFSIPWSVPFLTDGNVRVFNPQKWGIS
jgi:hypothetical protein